MPKKNHMVLSLSDLIFNWSLLVCWGMTNAGEIRPNNNVYYREASPN